MVFEEEFARFKVCSIFIDLKNGIFRVISDQLIQWPGIPMEPLLLPVEKTDMCEFNHLTMIISKLHTIINTPIMLLRFVISVSHSSCRFAGHILKRFLALLIFFWKYWYLLFFVVLSRNKIILYQSFLYRVYSI